MIQFCMKKWTGPLVLALILIQPQVVFAATIDVIADLQEQRVDVCKALETQDDKKVIKALKATSDFLDEQIKKSNDPDFSRRAFTPATRKLDLIYQADKIRKPQVNYIGDVYRAALAGLRVQYRSEIRNQILVEKNLKADFFEMDCKKLKK